MILDSVSPTLVGNSTVIVESVLSLPTAFDIDAHVPWLRYLFLAMSVATGLLVAMSSGMVYVVLSNRIDRVRQRRRHTALGSSSGSDDDKEGKLGAGHHSFLPGARTRALEDENRVLRRRMTDLESKVSDLLRQQELLQNQQQQHRYSPAGGGGVSTSPSRSIFQAGGSQRRDMSPMLNAAPDFSSDGSRYIVRGSSRNN
jgi:hypothetical protein